MEEKPDSKPFDTAMKQLAGGSPQDWVSFLLMISDILEESWVYQDILQKGKKQGIEEGQELSLLLFVELRFPSLLPQTKQVIERPMALQQLEALLRKLYSATTIADANAALQEVGRDG